MDAVHPVDVGFENVDLLGFEVRELLVREFLAFSSFRLSRTLAVFDPKFAETVQCFRRIVGDDAVIPFARDVPLGFEATPVVDDMPDLLSARGRIGQLRGGDSVVGEVVDESVATLLGISRSRGSCSSCGDPLCYLGFRRK